ncbi:uncharacterized protein FYW35_000417 [Pterocles gutturalis]
MEPGGEEEEEEERVPPIATTPPCCSWREESLSRSGSETQASVTSGISLGEAICRKTAVNWGTESWHQLPAEVDASRLTAASEAKLGLTCDRSDLTEFPTLEEGVLPSAEASRRQFPGDIQDSQFSPCLPLPMYLTQGRRFSEVMLLQHSEMDFIPLRGVPDVSGVSEEHSRLPHAHGCFFTSAKDDNFIPVGATPLSTPVKEELNIEERIPIYLRNLGIDQSPGTILTPFVPRGPIREVEFSPSELRTLKDSTDTLTRTIPQPQGELLSAVEITQTSFNSGTSTLSISIPMSSEVGSGILSPRELSPCFSGSFRDKPMSQRSMSCYQLERTALLSAQRETECSAVSKGAEPNQLLHTASPGRPSGREGLMLLPNSVQDLLAENESKDANGSLQRWTAGSLAGVKNGMEVDRGSQSPSVGRKRSKGQERDSLIGSGALQETPKLLAEDIAGRWCDPIFSTACSRETGESSPVLIRKEDDPEDSRLLKDSVPQFQKILSWDEAMTRRSMREEGSVGKPLNFNTGDLRWEHSFEVNLHNSEEMMKEMTKELRTGKSVGRSEPEGCSSVTTDRNQPGFVGLAQSNGSSEVSNGSSEVSTGRTSSSEPLGSVTNVPGGFQSMLAKASVARSKAGGMQESDGSSSGDSVAARVKNLLGNPSSEPLGSVTDVPGGFWSTLSKASAARSKAGGMRESDDSSSGDSVAARVKNLLRNGSPALHATQNLKGADEEERKARAWVKLKLTSRSQESVSDFNDKDQQRIEEIKAELLLSAKKSTPAKAKQYVTEKYKLLKTIYLKKMQPVLLPTK